MKDVAPTVLPVLPGPLEASMDARVRRAPRVVCRGRDRPRDRLLIEGPAHLSDGELVSIVLRTGDRVRSALALATDLLDRFGGVRELSEASAAAVESVAGLGQAKAASLAAAFELGRRAVCRQVERGRPIRSPLDVEHHFASRLVACRRESFHVLLLDGRHRFLSESEVSIGTLTASLVHPREVFREAIRVSAAALLLVHNHPSGDPTPSAEDRVVTARLVEAGELIGIRVVDHVIVAADGHFSFREAGALP